ncbi:MAG: histidine kinase [Actinobacteria bacterium]|nr:MAG: histidine kinase [Actinomycetota bacterium]
MKLFEKIGKRSQTNKYNKSSGSIAVYDSKMSPPRLISVAAASCSEFIEKLTTSTYRECQQKGVSFPYTVLREAVENLIHAGFKEVVISVLDGGNMIRISDQGPGIKDKKRAFEPGFTTASNDMQKHIRGVGSGLPLMREIMSFSGGNIDVENNLASGTVITLSLTSSTDQDNSQLQEEDVKHLTRRQAAILSLVTELSQAGPSKISKELSLTLSTVHRELVCLEEMGLLKSGSQGKRFSTTKGLNSLNKTVFNFGEI